jgi:anti-sigma regulatory factor (Ser/Thr protein kinase)
VETAAELDLPVDLRSVREARIFIAGLNGLAPQRLADAQLIVSELVTNALLHAGLHAADRIVLRISRHQRRLRIEVDDGGTFTADSESFAYSRNEDRAHGLRLIQLIALAWTAENGNVTAWLEL